MLYHYVRVVSGMYIWDVFLPDRVLSDYLPVSLAVDTIYEFQLRYADTVDVHDIEPP